MTQDLPHMEAKWLKGIWAFLRHINGFLILDEDFVPPLQRVGDKHIIDMVLESREFTPGKLDLSIIVDYIYLYILSQILVRQMANGFIKNFIMERRKTNVQ